MEMVKKTNKRKGSSLKINARQYFFGTKTAAEYLGVTPAHMKYVAHARGYLVPGKLNGRTSFYTRPQLDQFLATGRSDIRPTRESLLTIIEAAKETGITEAKIQYHIEDGVIHADKLGRTFVIHRDEINRFIDEGGANDLRAGFHRSIMTPETVVGVLTDRANGVPILAVAEKYGISDSYVSKIWNGTFWTDIVTKWKQENLPQDEG